MYGRYGSDHLNVFLIVLYVFFYLLSVVTGLGILNLPGLAALLFALYRIMSRNLDRRRAENAKFLTMIRPLAQWFKLRRTIHRDKDHRYFKCPNCGQNLRVPRGKGKIAVTCRSCGNSFEAKS